MERSVGEAGRERDRGGRVRESRARFAIDYRREKRKRMMTTRMKRKKRGKSRKMSSHRGHAAVVDGDDDDPNRRDCEYLSSEDGRVESRT